MMPYTLLIAKGGVFGTTSGTIRKNKIPHHARSRKNFRTAVMPKVFGSVKAFGDSEESYGGLLIPFC